MPQRFIDTLSRRSPVDGRPSIQPGRTLFIWTLSVFSGNVDDGLGKSPRGFLWQNVPNAACDVPVLIPAGELLRIGTGIGMWGTIRITFQSDGWHRDWRECGKPLFQIVILRLAFGKSQAPAIVMDHNADVIRVVEGRRTAIERGVVEGLLR